MSFLWVSCPRIDKCKTLKQTHSRDWSSPDCRMLLLRAFLPKNKTATVVGKVRKDMRKRRISKGARMVRFGLPLGKLG